MEVIVLENDNELVGGYFCVNREYMSELYASKGMFMCRSLPSAWYIIHQSQIFTPQIFRSHLYPVIESEATSV